MCRYVKKTKYRCVWFENVCLNVNIILSGYRFIQIQEVDKTKKKQKKEVHNINLKKTSNKYLKYVDVGMRVLKLNVSNYLFMVL